MKTNYLIILTFIILENNAFSQDSSQMGVYFSANDFQNQALKLKGSNKDIRIKANMVFRPSYVKVKTKEKVYYFPKDSIWGYKENNTIFRLFNHEEYTLIKNESFPIYVQRDHYRHFRKCFYYSENAGSPIIPFYLSNLEKSFQSNKKIYDSIHWLTQNVKELSIYDDEKRFYEIFENF